MSNEQSVIVERDVDKSNVMAGGSGNQQNISNNYTYQVIFSGSNSLFVMAMSSLTIVGILFLIVSNTPLLNDDNEIEIKNTDNTNTITDNSTISNETSPKPNIYIGKAETISEDNLKKIKTIPEKQHLIKTELISVESKTTALNSLEKKQEQSEKETITVENKIAIATNNDSNKEQDKPSKEKRNIHTYDDMPKELSDLGKSTAFRVINLQIEEKVNHHPTENMWIIKWEGKGQREKLWRYKLLRRSEASSWKVLKTFTPMSERIYVEKLSLLTSWEAYYYKIVPILDRNQSIGISSAIKQVTVLPTPTNFSLEQVDNKVNISWEWNYSYPIKAFAIYRFNYKGYAKIAYRKNGIPATKIGETRTLTWQDTVPSSCNSNYYLVRAIDSTGREGIETEPKNIPLHIIYPAPKNFIKVGISSSDFTRVAWDGFEEDTCDLKYYLLEAKTDDMWEVVTKISPSKHEYIVRHKGKNVSALRLSTINNIGIVGKAACLSLNTTFPCND